MPLLSFPDLSIIRHKGQWYAFATNSYHSTIRIQVATSRDYTNWAVLTNEDGTQYDAMPQLTPWIDPGRFETWAPDVVRLDEGSFVVYYSATKAGDGRHCISAAKAESVEGPYTPMDDILVCPDDSGGALDASGFMDWEVKGDWRVLEEEDGEDCGNSYAASMWSEGGFGGKRYIVYKIQNGQQEDKGIRAPLTLHQVCSKDGVTLVGGPVTSMENEGAADQHFIEASSLFKTAKGKYVLFFSAGNTVMPSYTLSYAVSDSLLGPYERKASGGTDVSFDGERMLLHGMGQPIGMLFDHLRLMHAAKTRMNDESGEIELVSL
ncbi:glycoside hydrolase family 43 protein [Polychaeton citri CBS 116435]|uniref:Endo-1,5-alpha-L-arabinanase A n=1 Tax=Polychaeton citri CBS 116435 TaxID=1314669 RepID=A0A9P4Q8Y1_9PEZI|nr:glycoside hydrolase family 43 protein [Polychaeton citri CBS 116435]